VGAYVVAALLALTGLVWMGQGLGYIKGSFMTGEMRWFWIGLGALVLGALLAGGARLSIPGPPRSTS
jgi:hypothetical protein